MKRGKPLRRTPLKRGTSQLKRTPLARGATQLKRTPMKKVQADDPIQAETRKALAERSEGRCEARLGFWCTGVATHAHHRKLRRYGDHSLACLLHVCSSCHTAIHAEPKWSYEHGFLVRQHEDTSRLAFAGPDGYPR